MVKVFLKDMGDRSTVIKYIIYAFILYTGLDYYVSKVNLNINVDLRFMLYLILGLGLTVYFSISTYISKEDTIHYYALPVKREEVNLGFIIATLIDTLVRKITLVFAAFFIIRPQLDTYITLLISLPIICIFGSVLTALNTNKKILGLLGSIIAQGLILYLCFIKNLYLIGLVVLGSYVYMIYKVLLADVYFAKIESSKSSKLNISNYFLKFFIAENVYIVNTIGIVIMLIIVSLFFPKAIALPMALAVATVNTPLLTIFSTDENLNNYKNLLPNTYRSLDRDYLKVLLAYFALVHLIILILNYKNVSLKLIIILLVFTLIDSMFAYYLEKKYPIRGKQTTMEVWRHPRKYILGILVFFASFVLVNII